MATLLTDFEGFWFNSARPQGISLDSSPVKVPLRITDPATLEALRAAANMKECVRCEILGVHGQFLTQYEPPSAHNPVGHMVDTPPVDIDSVSWSPSEPGVLLVGIRRTLPLSSSHGGQPLRLGFWFSTDVVCISAPFTVLAKQGKVGATIKLPKPARIPPLTNARTYARTALTKAVTGAAVPLSKESAGPAPPPRMILGVPVASTATAAGAGTLPYDAARPTEEDAPGEEVEEEGEEEEEN